MSIPGTVNTPFIVGLGLVNKDFVAVVPAWERDVKVAATHYFEQVGGPVPVALLAMARLGCHPCHCIGVTGSDRDGTDLAFLLEKNGVRPHLFSATGIATSRSLVLLDSRDGSRTLANYAETLPPLTLTGEHRSLLGQARLLHLDGRDLPASLEAAAIVRACGGLVSLDLGTMRPGRAELIRQCDIVIASKKGAAGAFPDIAEQPVAQVKRFLEEGIHIAAVTLGADGVVIGEQNVPTMHLPAFPVESVLDTCGAGDLFHGAFLAAYLQGETLHASAQFAQAAVALRIQSYGNVVSIPDKDTVFAFLSQHGDHT